MHIHTRRNVALLRTPSILCVTESNYLHTYVAVHVYTVCISRLTVVSHKAKKKQHMRPLSELFTRSIALKFANALAKPP